jgi:hypothetical protein
VLAAGQLAIPATAPPVQHSSAGTRTVGLVYDKAMEYHVREGTCVELLQNSPQHMLLHAAEGASCCLLQP